MNVVDFLETPEVQRLLERAAKSAGVPLSIHSLDSNNREGSKISGWGGCAACTYVSNVRKGRWACRDSRQEVCASAFAQSRPLTFICHLGFACVSAPVLPNEPYILTLGPYVPANAALSLEFDVRNGLNELEIDVSDELPFSLEDIHHTPPDALPAVVEWTSEALIPLWKAWLAQAEATAPDPELPKEPPPARSKSAEKIQFDPRHAENIAAALAGGNQSQARILLNELIAEFQSNNKRSISNLRAFVVRMVSTVLEAAERAKLVTNGAWEAYPQFIIAVRDSNQESDLLDIAMRLLGILKRETVRKRPGYKKLNQLLNSRLAEKITLSEAAAALEQSESALSHHLIRNYDMGFLDYLARLRVDKAKISLKRTNLPITEIARRVGVADQSHFTKLFKKFEGITPSEYRKKYRRSK